jgi:hypothetical protein
MFPGKPLCIRLVPSMSCKLEGEKERLADAASHMRSSDQAGRKCYCHTVVTPPSYTSGRILIDPLKKEKRSYDNH